MTPGPAPGAGNYIDHTEYVEERIQHAHLLCMHREYDEARRVLLGLSRQFPGNPEVLYLLGRIESTERVQKEEDDRRRRGRRMLWMDTTWRRMCWFLAGAGLLAYGVWTGVKGIALGSERGFQSLITSQVSDRRGTHNYTRPIYHDVVGSGIAAAAGATAITLVLVLRRGAAQWEELGTDDSGRGGPW